MTNEEKLEAIREIVQGAEAAVVRYYQEDFDICDYSGDSVEVAWVAGMSDGEIEVSKEILNILNK